MAQIETVKIKSAGGYTVINREDFDMNTQELHLEKDQIIVKPLGVDDADPFVIDEKDFDPKSYEKVSKSKTNLSIVADQVPRQTLAEKLEAEPSKFISADDNELTREFAKSNPSDSKEKADRTPQNTLKEAQKVKK